MVHEIDVVQLDALLADGATVIDVREPDEYAAAHVAGTRLVPMGELGRHIGELLTARPVYLICRSGNRSGLMCQALGELGLEAVNVRGGLDAWVASGRPVAGGAA
ncbi:rhodanese-like domain-containing protein [Nocardioides mangrovi]|uniref:Rhodanese-like domain-containing protein n=1 Tax=Nocardioides mangrovi TaxID=2874580 RepID=A0ABS7UE90_9ACTN|nr:rhodanese-like domain-containing protein [Nocardioides mangrovi]MBZ5739316.1 rhodanese-like domain-containing protein [Nocardioides mangrovi]